jgi:hypothetical protein
MRYAETGYDRKIDLSKRNIAEGNGYRCPNSKEELTIKSKKEDRER